jgi:hypothetical protein
VLGPGDRPRLVIAGIILMPADCSEHGFIAEKYSAAEIEALVASGYAIAWSSNGREPDACRGNLPRQTAWPHGAQFGFSPSVGVSAPMYSRTMMTDDGPTLTARHWAVLGIVRLSRAPVSPDRIANELHFDSTEVRRLLGELMARGYVSQPCSE